MAKMAKIEVSSISVECWACGEAQSPDAPDGPTVVDAEAFWRFPTTFDCAFCGEEMSRPVPPHNFYTRLSHGLDR